MVEARLLERLGEGFHKMKSNLIPTKRKGFTWDPTYIERTKEILEHLQKLTDNKKDISNKTVFFLCLSVGLKNDHKRPTPPRATDSARFESLQNYEFDLLRSVALSKTKNYMDVLEEDKLYDIIEQYAAGGLELLAFELDNRADFREFLVKELFDYMKTFNQM